jgi:hypothetical protein
MDHQRDSHHPRRFDGRGLAVFLVTLSFVVMLASGAALFIAPTGRIANDVGWTFLWLSRDAWQSLHVAFSVIFVTFGLAHLVANACSLIRHLRDRVSRRLVVTREAGIALLLTIVLMATSVLALPPSSLLHDLNQFFRTAYWSESGPPHGRRSTQGPASQSSAAPIEAGATVPADHPPITDDSACRDCHRN